MSHFGGGGGGHGGHGGFGHHGGHSGGHHSGGHPDQSPNWNSALQGEGKTGKFLTSLPNPTVVPIILALCVFMVMLLPFVIEWDWENLPWNKQSQEQESQPEATASVQADRELLDATKNSMIQAQASARAALLKQQQMAAAEQAGVDMNSQEQSQATAQQNDNSYQDQTQAQLQAQTQAPPQNYYPQSNYMQPQQSGAPLTAAPGLMQGYSNVDQSYGQGYQGQNYAPQGYDTSYSGQSYGSDRTTYTPTTPVGQHRFRVFAGR